MATPWKYEPARDFGLAPDERRRSLRREVGLTSACSALAWRWLTRVHLALFHRLRIEGREHLPARRPFVLIANHSSHLDAIILADALPVRHLGCVFPIAAGDTFFETRVASAFATLCMNALPIWRKKCGAHSLDELRDRLVGGDCIYILFPEGTRSRTGAMGGFKPGLGRLVAGTEVPVVPCRLFGAWEAYPPKAKLPRPARIRLRIGPPLLFTDEPNTREGWNAISARAEAAVRALV